MNEKQESVGEFVERQLRDHYAKTLCPATVADWVEDLRGFKFFHISLAFRDYRQSGNKYPPKSKDIIELAISHIKKQKSDTLSTPEKCCVDSCRGKEIDKAWHLRGQVWKCRFHNEQDTLKFFPNSPQAMVIRDQRKSEYEIQSSGLTAREYFQKNQPEWLKVISKNRNSEGRETARKKIITAVKNFYETLMSKEDRKQITEEIRMTVERARNRDEESVRVQ